MNKRTKQNEYPLQRIFDYLDPSPCVSYSRNAPYPLTIDGKINEINARELLQIKKKYEESPAERVLLAYFDNQEPRLLYDGEDLISMQRTIDSLRLPRWSDNVGERIFSRIRNDLKLASQTGAGCFEYPLNPGKEYHFRTVFKRLVAIYAAD